MPTLDSLNFVHSTQNRKLYQAVVRVCSAVKSYFRLFDVLLKIYTEVKKFEIKDRRNYGHDYILYELLTSHKLG